METITLITNIKCTGCLNKVTPVLNNITGVNNWQVNLDHPHKILKVSGVANADTIINAVQEAGFKAEKI